MTSKVDMVPETLCMGCMREKGVVDVCPHCYWQEGTPASTPLQLAPRTILNEHYIIGWALGQGGFGITYLGFDLVAHRKLAIKEYFPIACSTRAADRCTVSSI